jgi:hypothetical protein
MELFVHETVFCRSLQARERYQEIAMGASSAGSAPGLAHAPRMRRGYDNPGCLHRKGYP